MERISILQGDLPILLICPHGANNKNLSLLTDLIASEMGAFAIINKGWIIDSHVDYNEDKANCNDIRHVNQEVVKEEFLEPIFRTVAKIQKKLDERVFLLNIRECDNKIKKIANDEYLDIILGYGEGNSKNPTSYTCDLRIKNAFGHFLEKENLNIYEGKKNKKYSACSENNLSQLFTKWHPNKNVHTIQVSIVSQLIEETESINFLAEKLVGALDELLLYDDATTIEKRKIKWI